MHMHTYMHPIRVFMEIVNAFHKMNEFLNAIKLYERDQYSLECFLLGPRSRALPKTMAYRCICAAPCVLG